MDISSIALQGVAQAEEQAEAVASSLARAGAASAAGSSGDTVDIGTQILELLSAETLSSITLSVLKAADQIQQSAIDVTA
jgi:hypothetical protein